METDRNTVKEIDPNPLVIQAMWEIQGRSKARCTNQCANTR